MQGKTLYDRCRQTGKQALLDQWHPDRNSGLTPGQVTAGSHKKVWWRCKMGHEWQAEVRSRYLGTGCPYCAGKKAVPGESDLVTRKPELAAQWHPTKNGAITPDQVTPGSHKKVWWVCPKGHQWQALVMARSAGEGCPVCAGKAVIPGEGDSGTGRKTGRLLRIPSRLTATVRYGGAVKRGTPIRQRWPPEPTGGEAAPTAPERGYWPDLTT